MSRLILCDLEHEEFDEREYAVPVRVDVAPDAKDSEIRRAALVGVNRVYPGWSIVEMHDAGEFDASDAYDDGPDLWLAFTVVAFGVLAIVLAFVRGLIE